jgi:hypothetical protein
VRDEARSLADLAARAVDRYLRDLDGLASELARRPDVVQLNREQCARLFADLVRDHPMIVDPVLNAPAGAVIASRSAASPADGSASLPYVRQVISSGRPVVSGLTITQLTHQPAIVMAYPVRRDDSVVGVLDFGIDLFQLPSLFSDLSLPDGSVISLTDRGGLVLARSLEADRYVGTTVEIPALSPAGTSPTVSDIADADGVERVVASAAIGNRDWAASVGIPTRVIEARSWPVWRRTLFFGSLGVLGSLVLSMSLGRRLSRRATS